MRDRRRFSEAISEGDGISLIAEVDTAAAARQAEEDGAEALLVPRGNEGKLSEIAETGSLPVVFHWAGGRMDALDSVDACIVEVRDDDEHSRRLPDRDFEFAFRIEDDEQLALAHERYDPEIFVLAAPRGEAGEAFERVLDLLADVPAGKLAIAELPGSTREDVAALERAGIDGVIVAPGQVADLAGDEPRPV